MGAVGESLSGAAAQSRRVAEGLSRTLRLVEEAWHKAAADGMRAGRVPSVLAVSKRQPPGAVLAAAECGQKAFGENFVAELVEKARSLPSHIDWHFIGERSLRASKPVSSSLSLTP